MRTGRTEPLKNGGENGEITKPRASFLPVLTGLRIIPYENTTFPPSRAKDASKGDPSFSYISLRGQRLLINNPALKD
jgi:hypothetical protein